MFLPVSFCVNPSTKGSVQNLQKRAFFVKFYPKMLLLPKGALFCQILQRGASNYRMLIYSRLFLVDLLCESLDSIVQTIFLPPPIPTLNSFSIHFRTKHVFLLELNFLIFVSNSNRFVMIFVICYFL